MGIFDGSNALNRLANVLTERMHDTLPKDKVIDFGVILPGYKLKTNEFDVILKPDQYSVCRHCVGGLGNKYHYPTEVTTCHVAHRHEVHPIEIKPGDRVLVVWVDAEAVVVDVVWSATRL